MKQFSAIFLAIAIGSVASLSFDETAVYFVGSNPSDFKNTSIHSDFSQIYGTGYFDPSKPSVLLIHGFLNNYFYEFGKATVEAYIANGAYNILFFDWGAYTETYNYGLQVQRMPAISATAVQMLNSLQSLGYDLSRVHCVGHSLGAQMCGNVARQLKSKGILLDMVVGLDPAAPMFHPDVVWHMLGLNLPILRGNMLSRGDAKFVQNIHTNAGAMGSPFSTGDIDFWPNGGSNQEMCQNGTSHFTNEVCDHYAAFLYYAESVKSQAPNFYGIHCAHRCLVHGFENCSQTEVASMGLHCSHTAKSGDYLMRTAATAPYSQ